MKKRLLIIIPSVALALVLLAAFLPNAKSSTRNQVTMQLITASLNTAHYEPVKYDDSFSKKFYALYLDRMDGQKKFFLQSDVDEFKKFELLLDEQVYKGEFDFFDKVNEVYDKRVLQVEAFYKEMLSAPIDFSKEENIETDPDKSSFPKDETEWKDAWRKYLKYQVLLAIYETTSRQDKALEKKDTTVKQKPIALIEEEARKKTLKNNEELFERIKKISYADKISMYLNTVANIYDPHTEFFPVKEKKNFDIRMSGQLEGIGAQLQEKEGYVKVMRIVPGSPSWRQGELKAGDLIIKVAQGNNEPVDVVGMDIDDVVQLIRGKKGTEVRLTVKKPEGNIIIVSLIRDVVLLEETYAKSAIINTKKKIGYIKLPTFYADFENNSGRSCSGDVKKELEKLKAENVEGVILDLRDNGGGSLQDVVTMTGLFIKEGPIVQVKQKSGSPRVLKDYDGDVVYDGPLVIMINENSASASEILAAAIQDYKRGVVVGSSSSFGKGTVQQFLNLDDYLLPQFDSLKPLGSVKLTIQKFYRVNGGSTQLKGVVPDIEMPDVYKYYEYGEKELEYPMPWDEIESLKVDAWKDFGMAQVKKSSTERMQKSERFKLIESKAKKLKSQRDQSMVTLNLEKYKQYRKTLEQEMKQYDSIDDEVKEMNVTLLKVDLQNTDTLAKASGKELLTRMKKDIYLLESANIIGDIK